MSPIHEYHKRGWSIIPIPHGSKSPNRRNWQNTTFTLNDFPDGPTNVGIHLGERSGWLIDVDLDHIYAVELADQFLPETPAVFGRKSKPASHRLFIATEPTESVQRRTKDNGVTVEIRAGGQTVFPSSTHPSGELIEWAEWPVDPARINPAELRKAIERLHYATLARIATDAIGVEDNQDGSLRLLAVCCRCVEHDLDDVEALAVVDHYRADKPFAVDWSDDEVLKRLADARRKAVAGVAVGEDRIKLSKIAPEDAAETLIQGHFIDPAGLRVVHYAEGDFLLWDAAAAKYRRLNEQDFRTRIQKPLEGTFSHLTNSAVSSVLTNLRGKVGHALTPPFWADKERPGEFFACRSGLVDLMTGDVIPATPAYVNTVISPVEWKPDAGEPVEWLKFLNSVWGDDPESVRLLRQWFGYCLTSDTRQQKILLIIGPPRSGKGTVARVLRALLGDESVAGPTLAGLKERFGLQSLVDKPLGIISDARLSGGNHAVVVERLLSVSGEDALTIDRKNVSFITRKLTTRIMIMTNEIPQLDDASGALAKRFLTLRTVEEFTGREDKGLTDRLRDELPGILQWAAAGLRDLRSTGRFVQPSSGMAIADEMDSLASPVRKWAKECCQFGPGLSVPCKDAYWSFREWSGGEGIRFSMTESTFGKKLQELGRVERKRVRGDGERVYVYDGVSVALAVPSCP